MSSPQASERRLGVLRAGPRTFKPGRFAARRVTALALVCVHALTITAAPAQARTTYFRSASSIAKTGVSSIVLAAPSGMSVGDLLILNVDTNGGNTAFTPPTGWTTLSTGENYAGNSLGGGYSILAYKVIATTAEAEAASYTISLGTTRAVVARIVDYVGVKTSEPFENTFTLGTDPTGGTSTTSFSYPVLTTTAAGTVVVFGAVAFPTRT